MQTAEIDRQIKATTIQRDQVRQQARTMRNAHMQEALERQADSLDAQIQELHEKRKEAIGAAITRAMSK